MGPKDKVFRKIVAFRGGIFLKPRMTLADGRGNANFAS